MADTRSGFSSSVCERAGMGPGRVRPTRKGRRQVNGDKDAAAVIRHFAICSESCFRQDLRFPSAAVGRRHRRRRRWRQLLSEIWRVSTLIPFLLLGTRMDPPSLPPSLRQAETAHIASASVSWRDKIKFLDGGLVLRAGERNALGREGVREHADDINWHNARRPILICSFDVGKKTSAVHGMWTDLKEGISGEGGLSWKANCSK